MLSTKTARPPFMSDSPPAGSGRPRTTGRRGRRSSTSIPSRRLATSRWRRRTPTSSTSAPENRTTGRAPRSARGVYKSTDGGKEFVYVGLKETQSIGRVVVHPKDPNIVYVAAVGHLFGPNPERGLYKTTDGGKTWTNTKFIDNDTGFTDVVMDPSNPNVLIAASYQRRRQPWGFNGGGPGSGIWKTTDGARPGRSSPATAFRTTQSSAASASTSPDRSPPPSMPRSKWARAAAPAPASTRTARSCSPVRAAAVEAAADADRRLLRLPIPRRAASGARTTAARPGGSCRTRATAGCTTARSGSIPPTRRSRTRAARRSSRASMAERTGGRSPASRTATITPSGSIRRTTTTSCSATTAAWTCRTTRVRRGNTSTRWRWVSSTRSAPTCGSRTTSAAACRTTGAGAARAACAAPPGS